MQSKLRIGMAILIAASAIGIIWHFKAKYADHLAHQWVIDYVNGDDVDARRSADKMHWIDEGRSNYFLAQMAISDWAISLGKSGATTLVDALSSMESENPDKILQADRGAVLDLMASLAAMLGDVAKAKTYHHRACAFNRFAVDDQACLEMMYRSNKGMLISSSLLRIDALDLYKTVKLAEAIGGIDQDELAYGEALALVAFDKDEAIHLRNQLAQEGKMTPQRTEEFEKVIRISEQPAPQIL